MKKYLFLFFLLTLGAFYAVNNYNNPHKELHYDSTVDMDKLTGAEKFALYHSNIRKSPEGSPYLYQSGYQATEYNKLKKRLPESKVRELT